MTIFGFAVLAVLFFVFVSGIYVFVYGCVRRKELPWLVQEEIDKTPYKKYGKAMQAAHQWLAEHNAQDVWTTSSDGKKLHALWVSANNAKATVLLVHGYRSTPLLDFAIAYPFYYERGFNILVPDQRSHGKSEGRFITFGVMESNDMEQWVAYHNENFGTVPMVLHGLSMGAATVLYMTDRVLPDNVKGFVADCGFTSPKEILSSVFRSVVHLPAFPSILVTECIARLVAGFSLWQCDTRKSLHFAKLPVMMVHGKDDDFVPCKMTEEGYEACVSEKSLLLVDGAKHGVSFLVVPDRYQEMLSNFIEKYIIVPEER